MTTERTQAEDRLDEILDQFGAGPVDLTAPVAERQGPRWPVETEYDAMAVGFRIAGIRARAAWAKHMAEEIAREAAAAEERIVYAVGGRRWTEGGRARVGYGSLEEWARAHLTRGRKSIKTPAGTFAFREAPAVLHIPEGREAALLDWCRENAPNWIKTTESIDLAAIKSHIEQTGEVPADANGEQLVEYLRAGRHDLFSFKPAAGAEALPAAAAQPARLEESTSP